MCSSICNQLATHAQALLASTLNRLEGLLDTLVREGFPPLQAAYLGAWLHTGQQVPCHHATLFARPHAWGGPGVMVASRVAGRP